jgi:hypothetical protein
MSEDKKRAELHSLFPAETDLQGTANRLIAEATGTFGKAERFDGHVKTLKMKDEDRKFEEVSEVKEIATTVVDKLNYVFETVAAYYDAFVQKERTNQEARSDVLVDGQVLVADVPATALLGLEKRLLSIRQMCEAIPTLPPGIRWIKTENAGVYMAEHADEKVRTEKDIRFKSIAKATPQHPEQVEKWTVDVPIGKYITEMQSARLSPADKSKLLGRIDKLMLAVKQARTRANSTPVVHITIGNELLGYILGDLSES